MSRWETLAQEAESLQGQVYHWPAAFSERIQHALESFDGLCISRLKTLLLSALTDQNKNIKIRRLFSMRWTVVANTSLDYTLNPALPSNVWYLAIAKHIAGPDEAIIQILMPTVKKVIGTGMDDGIRLSTELPGRIVHLQNFIFNADQDSLISVDDVFNYAKEDTHYLFPAIQMDQNVDAESLAQKNKNLFPFTASDRDALRKITPEATHFFDLLKQVHTVRYNQKPSVGFALFELHEALLRSSKIALGADMVANLSECQRPIVDFYHVWMALSDSKKNKISGYRARGGTVTLRGFLLTLFSHTPGIELSDAEYAAVDPDVVPCTHVIGQQLKTLLAHNLDLQNMPLPDRMLDFYLDIVPTDDELNEAKEKCIQSLSKRQLIAGADDSQIVSYNPFFTAFTDNLLESTAVSHQILRVESEIKNLSHLKCALLLLPEAKWDYLLLLARDNIMAQAIDKGPDVMQNEGVTFISQVLKSTSSWVNFFEALSAQKYDFFLRGDSLSRLLYEFNESRWQDIVIAMGQYPALILSMPKDIADLLDATGIEHYRRMSELFRGPIAAILNTPEDYADLFGDTSREIWPQIFALFSRTLVYYIQNQKLIDEVLQILNPERRISFIQLLIASGVSRIDVIKNLHHILPRINIIEWRDTFRIIQMNNAEYPSTQIELLSLLQGLNVELWRYLYISFENSINALIGDPEKLGFILKNISLDKWQSFFIEFFPQRKEMTGDFFVACLVAVPEKNRLKLIELMLKLHPVFSLQSGYFADALNLISPGDWSTFAGFFRPYALKTPFSSVLNIQQFLKKIPVEKWDAVKNVFLAHIDTALRDEVDLIMVASELSRDKIPAFFALVSNTVKRHVTDLGYLKTVFFHVHNQDLSLLIALSVAEQVKKFEIDARELVAVSTCAEAMQLSNILSSVFDIFGKAEIIQYIKNHFLFFAGHDPSQVESWKLLYANSHLRVVDFTKFPAPFAMIFYLVPVHDWPILVDLFLDLFKMKMRDSIFLRDFLWFLPAEQRLALCSALVHHFDESDLSFGHLHSLFSTLPEKDWRVFLPLIEARNPAIKIEGFDELALMVRQDISSFKKWHSLLGGQIDALIAQSTDLVKLFCLFSEERWSAVAETSQLRIIEQLQKVDFLKNTLHSLNPERRFLFLRAISPYFDRIPVNTTIIINVFSMLAPSCWVDVVKLFGKEVLSRAIANESDLLFILHGIVDNQFNFLQAIKHCLPLIRLDHPESFVRLLDFFDHHCEALLLNLFRKKLVEVLVRFISHFMIQDDLKSIVTDREKLLFNALVLKLLPTLLSASYFNAVFDSRDAEDSILFEKMYAEFHRIESEVDSRDLKALLRQKLAVVREFIQAVEKDLLREKSESETVRFAVRERLYLKLTAHFGPHFFYKILQYAACFQEPLVPPGIRPNRVALFPQRPIATPRQVSPEQHGGAAAARGMFLENLFLAPPRL